MAEYKLSNEGGNRLLTTGQGQPGTSYFFLSTKTADQISVTDTLVGAALGEIVAAGRKSQAAPAPAARVVTYAAMTWVSGATGAKSIIRADTVDNTGRWYEVWNIPGGPVGVDAITVDLVGDKAAYQSEP